MISLSDIRDYIDGLGLAERVYQSRLNAKSEKSIGVYNSKHAGKYRMALGGMELKSYGIKNVTFLIHWNKSPRETEKAAMDLFSHLEKIREATINEKTIKFIQLLNSEPVDVGTDENGICEMVIEAAVIYSRR